MAINFTPEQQKVIELRNRNILVSAAAGSGKTAVLVERIIRMITDEKNPVDIDRLLIVTFTNAAAAEMRERISLAIDRSLSENLSPISFCSFSSATATPSSAPAPPYPGTDGIMSICKSRRPFSTMPRLPQ